MRHSSDPATPARRQNGMSTYSICVNASAIDSKASVGVRGSPRTYTTKISIRMIRRGRWMIAAVTPAISHDSELRRQKINHAMLPETPKVKKCSNGEPDQFRTICSRTKCSEMNPQIPKITNTFVASMSRRKIGIGSIPSNGAWRGGPVFAFDVWLAQEQAAGVRFFQRWLETLSEETRWQLPSLFPRSAWRR